MVDTRRTEGSVPELGRRESGGVAPRVFRPGEIAAVHRDRIPTLRQLANLVVNGFLTLPRNYRRGMFLDILA